MAHRLSANRAFEGSASYKVIAGADFHLPLTFLKLKIQCPGCRRMEVIKTVRVPAHYALTNRKFSILEHLTARHSYAVHPFTKLIQGNSSRKYGEFNKEDTAEIGRLTKLNTCYLQQCRDQGLWINSVRNAERVWSSVCDLSNPEP